MLGEQVYCQKYYKMTILGWVSQAVQLNTKEILVSMAFDNRTSGTAGKRASLFATTAPCNVYISS